MPKTDERTLELSIHVIHHLGEDGEVKLKEFRLFTSAGNLDSIHHSAQSLARSVADLVDDCM